MRGASLVACVALLAACQPSSVSTAPPVASANSPSPSQAIVGCAFRGTMPYVFPDLGCTPGEADAGAAVCPAAPAEPIPAPLAAQIVNAYRVADMPHVLDRLVPADLGGLATARNLWPPRPETFQLKDRVDRAMHAAVCRGDLELPEAQREIGGSWVLAYQRWVGPLPAPD